MIRGMEAFTRSAQAAALRKRPTAWLRASRKLITLLYVAAVSVACGDRPPVELGAQSMPDLLSQPLWIQRDAYDASHHLMVPMHAAFARSDAAEIERYANFFRSFQSAGTSDLVSDRLDRLHFLYFYTRFIALLAMREGCSSRTLNHYEMALSLWRTVILAPAWQWDRADFPSLFDRVRWKLNQKEVAFSYYRAIIDEDLFALAVGADLSALATRCKLASEPQYEDVRTLARAIYSQELSPTEVGGWIFQKGVWMDHPDYAYAGRTELASDLQPAPVPDISPDSSHSFRQPLFLISFACAEQTASPAREFYTRQLNQLAVQWKSRVVLMPDSSFRGARMTNYMNGENGVYRYGYVTQGKGNGFGPYQLSGSLNLGWWSFLGAMAAPVYQAQLASLPFVEDVLTTYTGPNTSRVRNSAFTEPDFYKGALIRNILDSAVQVSSQATWCQ